MTNEEQYHIKVNAAMLLMSKSSARSTWPIDRAFDWIRPPVLLGQIFFFRDSIGPNNGYVTWAYLTEETERRLIDNPNASFHLSEWNEGDRLWIMDLVVINGEARRHILQALKDLLPHHSIAKSLRRYPDGTARKVAIWRRRLDQ